MLSVILQVGGFVNITVGLITACTPVYDRNNNVITGKLDL
jgi:hypothetical protein